MDLLPPLFSMLAVSAIIAFLVMRRNREGGSNAPLRNEIEMQVCFATSLYRASRFAGNRSEWIPLRGPKRLIVGTDAFMISAPQALREFVFRGRECSITVSQSPSRFVKRDWIVITGQADGHPVRLAISHNNLPEVWQALARTGAGGYGSG